MPLVLHRKLLVAGLALFVLWGTLMPNLGLAKTKRPAAIEAVECHDHTAFFPIPADQAQEMVPDGFVAYGSPMDVQQVIIFYVSSYRCGSADEPALDMVTTYISVDPGDDQAPDKSYYVVDAAAEGPLLPALRKKLCLKELLLDGSIDITQERERTVTPLGPGPQVGAAVTSVDSEVLAARTVVSAEGLEGPRNDFQRWYFGDGSRFFETSNDLEVWGIGSSSIVFTEPYRGLPASTGGFSSQGVGDITFTGGCKPR